MAYVRNNKNPPAPTEDQLQFQRPVLLLHACLSDNPVRTRIMMFHIGCISLFVYALLALLSSAHNIQLGAHSRECFHETLRKGDKMTVTFQVGDREFGGSGNIEIDFWVGPICSLLFAQCPLNY